MIKQEDVKPSIWNRSLPSLPERDEFRRLAGLVPLVEAAPKDIILKRMGGASRLRARIGTGTTISNLPNGIEIKLPVATNSKGNLVSITQRDDRTYDVEFINLSGKTRKSLKRIHGVYLDQIVPTFEKHTGHYLHLT